MKPTAITSLLLLCELILCHVCFAEDSFRDALPRVPFTEAADALQTFKLAEGFAIQQVAAEPLIASPVAIEWDADGALYVCEMRGYSEQREEGLSRVARLEDTDHDGVYDRRTTFVEGLLWPTAIFPFDGGLFIADAPHIYYCRDTDHDGIADERSVVLTGFGTSNVQGLLNSFRWGLDQRIHVACGTVGGKIYRPDDGPDAAVDVRGRDLAFDPRTFALMTTSGGGQHGMSFDDWGRKYVSSNSDHLQQVLIEERYLTRNPLLKIRSTRLSIAADGPQAEVFRISPVEPWRIVRTRLRVAGEVPGPVEGGGRAAGYFTGATGVTIYRGDAYPEAFRGMAIVGDVGSNLVHRKRLTAAGVPRRGERIDAESEWVASTDIWFRPAQFACGPDGTVYVVDVCREVIEHPKSLPPMIKQHLDLTAGRDSGRLYRIVPEGYRHRPTPNLTTYSTAELVALFEHRNAWHRETASRLLFERQDPQTPSLLKRLQAESTEPLARLHALAWLSATSAVTPTEISRALQDEAPGVRRWGLRSLESLIPRDDAVLPQWATDLRRLVDIPTPKSASSSLSRQENSLRRSVCQ